MKPPKIPFSLPSGAGSKPIHPGQGASQAIVPGPGDTHTTAAHPPPHRVLPAPLGRCPETGASLSTPAAGSWSRGIGSDQHVTGGFLLSPPWGKWLWSKQAVYLLCAEAVPCSATPGGTGQWGALRSPYAFPWVEAGQASYLPAVKEGGLGRSAAARSSSKPPHLLGIPPQYICAR